jgi:hypothetical protein
MDQIKAYFDALIPPEKTSIILWYAFPDISEWLKTGKVLYKACDIEFSPLPKTAIPVFSVDGILDTLIKFSGRDCPRK